MESPVPLTPIGIAPLVIPPVYVIPAQAGIPQMLVGMDTEKESHSRAGGNPPVRVIPAPSVIPSCLRHPRTHPRRSHTYPRHSPRLRHPRTHPRHSREGGNLPPSDPHAYPYLHRHIEPTGPHLTKQNLRTTLNL